MTLKINSGLLVFGIMVSAIFGGIAFALPSSITNNFPPYSSPQYAITNLQSPPSYLGLQGLGTLIEDNNHCSIGWIECVSSFFNILLQLLIKGLIAIVYYGLMLFNLLAVFLLSGFFVIALAPIFISFPLGVLLAVIDFLVIGEIIIVIIGLLPTK